MRVCFLCSESESTNICGDCKKAFCSEEHKALHKLPENGRCMPIDILQDELKGRYVVASRDIEPGEMVFIDRPIVVGPNHEVPPVCITCSKEIDLSNICSRCGYPYCDLSKCELLHESSKECQILSQTKSDLTEFKNGEVNYENWFAILPLRLLLLKESKPLDYALIEKLMDHSELASKTERWKEIEEHVIKRLNAHFDSEDIKEASGKLDVNAYEIQSNFRGLFPLSSLLSHGCLANVEHLHSHSKPYINSCRATRRILKGEEVLANYICPFLPYLQRQKRLQNEWYFECNCSRCALGQTEYLDHVKCTSCDGYAVPNMYPTEEWKCLNCSNVMGGKEFIDRISSYEYQLSDIIKQDRYNIERYLNIYNNLMGTLHPQHELCIRLYRWLVPIYCREETQTSYTLADIQRKKKMSDALLEVFNNFTPGLTRYRGKVLSEVIDVDYKLLNANCQRSEFQDLVTVSKKIQALLQKCEEVKTIFSMGELSKFEQRIQKVNNERISYFNKILETL